MTEPRYPELVAHCAQSLLNAKVFSKPYPHLSFEKFWPEDFYRELLVKRPELDNYVQLNRENTRRQFTLFDGACDAGDDASHPVVSDVLASPEMHGRGPIETPPEKPRFSLLNAYQAKPVTEAVY